MLQSCFESSVNELLLRYKKRKWLLELESTPGKDDVKIAEMTTKYLEHYIILIYKAAAEFENIDSNLKDLPEIKCYQIACMPQENYS